MKYLIFNGEAELNIRNHQIAESQGCNKNLEDETVYWFASIKHPAQNLWALYVNDESLLTENEREQLKNYDNLAMDGWFFIE